MSVQFGLLLINYLILYDNIDIGKLASDYVACEVHDVHVIEVQLERVSISATYSSYAMNTKMSRHGIS